MVSILYETFSVSWFLDADVLGYVLQIDEGDGAFYGPKIDISVSDALKRKFQCATLQVEIVGDYNISFYGSLQDLLNKACGCSLTSSFQIDLSWTTQRRMKPSGKDLL